MRTKAFRHDFCAASCFGEGDSELSSVSLLTSPSFVSPSPSRPSFPSSSAAAGAAAAGAAGAAAVFIGEGARRGFSRASLRGRAQEVGGGRGARVRLR
jgi:hypothetical protein